MKHYQPNMYYLLSYLRYLDRNKDDLASQERNLSMAVKIMKYSLCNKAAKPHKLASKQPSTRFDDLFSIQCKNCAIEIACIDSPHIVIYTTHASSTAHCYILARRRRTDGSNSSAAAAVSPSQHSPKRPSHGHQRRSTGGGGAPHRL